MNFRCSSYYNLFVVSNKRESPASLSLASCLRDPGDAGSYKRNDDAVGYTNSTP